MKQSDLPAAKSLPDEPLESCRRIAESMPLMVWTAGADGSTISCNRRLCAYTGLGASELQCGGWFGALHPDDRARVEQRWRHALATGESYEEEIRLRRHDGAYRWQLDTASPLKDASGRIVGWLGVCTDIGDRKSASELLEASVAERTRSLRESEARFHSLADLAAHWHWEQDEHFRFTFFSPDVESVAGSSVDSHLGKTRWELPTVGVTADAWAKHREMLEAHLPFHDFEFQRIDERGETIWLSASGVPVFDDAGRFRGYRGIGRNIGRNITGRKRAELALRQSSERYQALVDSIDGIVWEADPKTFAFHFVSDNAERLLGYPKQQWTGEPDFLRRHIHPEDVEWAIDYCAHATADKRNHSFEYRMVAPDGRAVWLRDLVTVVVEGNEVVRLCGVMVDITERKQAEQALRQSEERFRALTALSSDFYWETDSAHRFRMMEYGKPFRGPMPSAEYIGKTRWEVPYVAPDEDGWRRYREMVDAHRSIRGFAFARRGWEGVVRHYEVDGDPLFDAAGTFLGYRGVGRDVTERLYAERALRDSERRIRGLLMRLTDTQEAERRRIAADLHDLVGQNLTALGVGLETLRTGMPQEQGRQHAPTFEDMAKLLKDTMDTVRQTMSDLRPPLLDDYGLVAALESHARQFGRRTGLSVTVEGESIDPRPAPNVELALFRVAQEALANAAKHAGASRARITLARKGGFLRLSIEDDGAGFAQPFGARAARRGGWGLPIMRERAEEAGGTLRIEFPARGTRVVAEVPHVDPNHPG